MAEERLTEGEKEQALHDVWNALLVVGGIALAAGFLLWLLL